MRAITASDLDTPALVVDLDVVDANIADMAAAARAGGVGLRPHTKTHKMPALAARQVAAGATGLTVAKVGEAEVMVDAGFDDVLIAYPIVGESKLRRLAALRGRAKVRISLDDVDVARAAGAIAGSAEDPLEVLVEVDTGLHRMGRPPGTPTVELAVEVDRLPGVRVVGLLTHAGHAYATTTPDARDAVARDEGGTLAETADACRRAGVGVEVVTVGSTPTSRVAAGVPGVTEVRPGTYVFNDASMMRLGVATEETCAATVLATVVSSRGDGTFVVDAGSKALAADGAGRFSGREWIIVAGRPDLELSFISEEHGVGRILDGGTAPRIGDRLSLIPHHICPVANLFDVAFGVRGGEVVEELVIAGRGRSQ